MADSAPGLSPGLVLAGCGLPRVWLAGESAALARGGLAAGIGPAFLAAAALVLPACCAAGLGGRPQRAGCTSRQLSLPSTTRRPG